MSSFIIQFSKVKPSTTPVCPGAPTKPTCSIRQAIERLSYDKTEAPGAPRKAKRAADQDLLHLPSIPQEFGAPKKAKRTVEHERTMLARSLGF